jgi:hypothetical protein
MTSSASALTQTWLLQPPILQPSPVNDWLDEDDEYELAQTNPSDDDEEYSPLGVPEYAVQATRAMRLSAPTGARYFVVIKKGGE